MTRREAECRDCGAPIVLVLVIPKHIVPGTTRKHVPLDPTFDPDAGTPPSHAVSIGWTTCHPLGAGDTPGPSEWPALTHFATCPARPHQPQASTTTGARP